MATMRTRAILAAAAALIAFSPALYAQAGDGDDNPLDPTIPKSKVLVGPRVGVNRNFHTGGFRVITDPLCPIFESGSGWGFQAGITAEFQPGKLWSIVPAVTYDSRPGSFSQSLPDALVLLSGMDTPVNQTVSTKSEVQYQFMNIEVLYKQSLVPIARGFNLAVTAGPAFQYIMSGKIDQTMHLDEPENARFIPQDGITYTDNGRTAVFRENADIPNMASTRFSLKLGVEAEISLFKDAWILYPGVFYDYGLTDVTDAENWQLSTILFQVDLRRAF